MKTYTYIIAAMLALVLTTTAKADCFSEGVRVGTLQKFSKKGVVSKSWEGELVMEGIKSRSGQTGTRTSNVWKFSANDPAVAAKIDEAIMSGKEVAMKYCEKNFAVTTDTPYIVTQVVIR